MRIDEYGKAEDTNIDFKEKLETDKPKSWLKSVSAFANTKGGIILYGIRDKTHEKVGITDAEQATSKIAELINDRISPIPRYVLEVISEDGKDFIALEIGQGSTTPYYYCSDGKKEAYVRFGDQSKVAPDHILKSLILKGKNITYDQLETKFKLEDVSFTLLEATLKNETGEVFNKDKDYISLNLVHNNHITNAGLLLSDQGLLKQSKVVCTKWKGFVKGSVEGDAIDDKEYTGSIIAILENVETFIRNNSKASWEIVGMQRVEHLDYPSKAIREAIVNAIIHRDYQMTGTEIHVDMFEDRLEIVSPGGMLDGTIIQNSDLTKIPSMRRNIVISDIFNRLHFMDRRGSGLSRIVQSYIDCDRKPIFTSESSYFCVVFPNKGYKKEIEDLKKTNEIIDIDLFTVKLYQLLAYKVSPKLLIQIQDIFKEFGYENEFKREDIEEILKVKRTRASDIIKTMTEANVVIIKDKIYKFKRL
ncbi:MAG: ATP-binding protein [Clostridia bacterium]